MSNRSRITPEAFSQPSVQATYGLQAQASYLTQSTIPSRPPPFSRPKVGHWVVPQRQLTDHSPKDVKAKLLEWILAVPETEKWKGKTHTALSAWEKRVQALFVNSNDSHLLTSEKITHAEPEEKKIMASKARYEVVHMHPVDGSMHLVLSPKDAGLVIERGWGERMGLAGRRLVSIPEGYLLIYAPTNEEELEVVKRIIEASMQLLLGEDSLDE